MNDCYIKTTNLSKSYADHVVLKNVSLSIKEGTVTSIIGKSGSGKTTLLNLIGGLDKPTSGDVFIDNENVTRLNEKKLSQFRSDNIGFVFQFFNLIPELTVWENIIFPMAIMKNKIDEEYINCICGIIGLEALLERIPAQLSGGEQQRVAIARAIAAHPKLLLMDEPTGNLDEKNTEIVVDLIRDINLKTGVTILIVTHDTDVAKKADSIIHIVDGNCFQ